ncbi:MAG: hypothetical protein ACRECH_02450 [Nitrososphaerales archaeon]
MKRSYNADIEGPSKVPKRRNELARQEGALLRKHDRFLIDLIARVSV